MWKIKIIGLLVVIAVGLGSQAVTSDTYQQKNGSNESSRVFSPRMDYDEWTPLGRGDPLKNDPTFDYVPPVLERVQYWLGETQLSSTESSSSPKRDVLVLGVTAKKTSQKLPDEYHKYFVDSSFKKYPHDQALNILHQSTYKSRNEFTGSTGAEPPKVIRNNKFRSGPSLEYRITNQKFFGNSQYSDKSKPYTMMIPPPAINAGSSGVQYNIIPNSVSNKKSEYPTRQEYSPGGSSSSTSVSFEKSNLIYHKSTQQQNPDWSSSSSGGSNPAHQNPVRGGPSLLAWPTESPYNNERFEDDHHQGSASMNHEVVVVGQNTQNANIIVDNSEDNSQVVVGQNNNVEPYVENFDGEKPRMEIVLANSSSTMADLQNETVTIVMPTNFNVETTTEEGLSETTSSIPSATMSMISFPATTITTTTTMSSPLMWPKEPPPSLLPPPKMPNKIIFPRRPTANIFSGMQSHSMMQQSYRITTPRPSPLGFILRNKEMITTSTPPTTIIAISSSSPPTTTTMRVSTTVKRTTPPSTTTGTTAEGYTTDPIFSHYKQPSMPINGPMYLIIQGHSKVKTYKPMVTKHDVVPSTTERLMTKFEKFINDNERRIITTTVRTNAMEGEKLKKNKHENLMKLVEKGVSAFTVSSE